MAESQIDVVELMKERLPSYAVNCLLAAGYDSTNVICSMNTSEGSESSLSIIEKFIDQHFRGHEDYYSNKVLAKYPFMFPPLHKVRIIHFVSEVKNLCKPTLLVKQRKRKQQVSSHDPSIDLPLPKKSVHTVNEDSVLSEPKLSLTSVTTQIRSNVCRWVRAQSSDILSNLKESQHYQINVTNTSRCV